MHSLIKAGAVLASLVATAPAFAQSYGPGPDYGYGYQSDPGYGYGQGYPAQNYGSPGPDYGYGGGYGGGYAAAPGPVYQGRSVAVAPGNGPDNSVAYCQSRYRSYNPQTGTFLGYDGQQHPCP